MRVPMTGCGRLLQYVNRGYEALISLASQNIDSAYRHEVEQKAAPKLDLCSDE